MNKSLLGKEWTLRPVDEAAAKKISGDFSLPFDVAKLLAGRGVSDVEIFLKPSLAKSLPDPFVLTDMERAVMVASAAILADEKIAVFGDYDVDGITSVAVMVKYLGAIGYGDKIVWRLPSREGEGYGLSELAVDEFHAAGAKLIISVDCGISAHREIVHAKKLGMKAVITDHHNQDGDIPDADAVVDPKRDDDKSGLDVLAGVGVVFMFLVALNRKLREIGYFTDARPEPDMKGFLDLVALGTICDTMPLTGVNRAIVRAGLRVANLWQNLGLKILADVAGAKAVDVYSAGFMLGPRLNASGRLASADDSLKLLLTESEDDARAYSHRLDALNARRKDIEQGVLMLADEMIEAAASANCILVCGKGWHGGVMGIIAGRLKEKYYRPVCVAAIKDDGTASGSARSVPEIDIGAIIESAKNLGILLSGGGHKVAAGFSLDAKNIEAFRAHLDECVAAQLAGKEFLPRLTADLALPAAAATLDLVRGLEAFAPFGQGNPEPTFIIEGATFDWAEPVGNGHVRAAFGTGMGKLSAIGFGLLRTPVGEFLVNETNRGRQVKLFGKLKENVYNGSSSVQLVLEDIYV
ncbi:MAG: single-stranded-DNA-specific exonuclease RecJ [Rickettsiales bacterium]|jgi:single-stranded-DNA-specific exonuclease|nr:single-stranded-DNA-specific exonuclease RecJ [Rickettsiales bacterium]